jgi:eukaryotic-like serine/threonine-protein kinase
MLGLRRFGDGEALLRAAMHRWSRTNAPEWRSARSMSSLGEAVYRQGRSVEAEALLANAHRALQGDSRTPRDVRAKARERISDFYLKQGQQEKLDELMMATTGGRPN